MKNLFGIYTATILIFLVAFSASCQKTELVNENDFPISIPVGGNCWAINDNLNENNLITDNAISGWNNKETVFRIYFKTENTGKISVALKIGNSFGTSEIKVKLDGTTKNLSIKNTSLEVVSAGNFTIKNPGYHFIEIEGIKKAGEFFPEIKALLLGGEAAIGKVYFAKEEFYWARRGPSVHLNFHIPEDAGGVEYFYSEINVPKNNDVLGSYFMADGFGEGYFGMQVNSETERRVLFSVWSPFQTDNPNEIPEEQKIKLLKKGEDVQTGEFGSEGSGGQSFLRFNWKAGNSYGFLLKAQPTGTGETDYTAWFFAPEENNWRLIASFRRPQTNTYLTHLYSFLENFMTETGNITRMALYSNQWIFTSNEKWIELNTIKFTADATARKESRMDYSGGTEGASFFLKNCGFFNETTTIDTYFTREENDNHPEIDFESLP